ncbi:MAG: hypothetical protein K6D59_08675 [Bacteroidales bacterium]|nr:hypothetical protein [Bacteroidales bacterium]
MKKTLILLSVLCTVVFAQAQYYNSMGTMNKGRIGFYGGVSFGGGGLNFTHSIVTTDGYGYQWYNEETVQPTTLSYRPSFSFMLTYAYYTEMTERLKLGGTAGFGYSGTGWQADFNGSNTPSTPSNSVHLETKGSLYEMQVGISGEVSIVDNVALDFSVGPYFQILSGIKTRGELYNTTGTLITDADANEWHKAENASDMGMFNLDVGVYGRVGVNYYFTETLWAGIAGQLHGPFFNPSTFGGFEHDSDKRLDYGYRYSETKRRNWSIMLHFGIDLD